MSFFKTEFGELINIDAIAHIRPEGDSFKVSFNGASGFYITNSDYEKIGRAHMDRPYHVIHKEHVDEISKEAKPKPSKKVKKKVGRK